MPIFGLSIISTDNNSNWKNTPATNLATNRPNFSTCLQSKFCYSNNTNKQLADILSYIVKILIANQISGPNSNLKKTKAYILNIFDSTKFDKLNNFLFQHHFYFYINFIQFNIDIMKINFIITYLTEVV